MNFYRLGNMESVRIGYPAFQEHYANGVRIGAPLVATPGAIRDEVQTINTEVRSMDEELGAERRTWLVLTGDLSDKQKVMDSWFNSVWLPFFVEWNGFFSGHGDSGAWVWLSNLWGSTWSQAQDYRRRLGVLRRSAETAGYGFQSPPPEPPKEHPLAKPLLELGGILKTVLWASVILAGGLLLLKFIGGVR